MRFSLHRHYYRIIAALLLLAVLLWTAAFIKSLSRLTPTSAPLMDDIRYTIVIDPGHGGIDPGTTSENGLQEKTVNLNVASSLASFFSAAGYPTVLTRSADTDLSTEGKSVAARKTEDLKARLALFEQTPNAVVLSVHQNHYDSPSSHGAQMFYGTANPLSQTIAQSIQTTLSTALQPDNTRQIKPIDNSVYIIRHTTKPAVLCECGFLSNPTDAANLSDPAYCSKIAFCIFVGVLNALQTA